MQEEHSRRAIGGGNGRAFRWLMANCTGLGFSSRYKTMFSEQLPAAARCCRGACAPDFDQQNNVFRLYIGKNKNPVVVVVAAAAAASQGCVEKNTRRVTRTHIAAGRATTMTSTRRRRPSGGVGATRSSIPTMLITRRSGVGPAAPPHKRFIIVAAAAADEAAFSPGRLSPKIFTPPAGITATATTTVNGVLVVETRERAQHQRFIAAYNHYFIFFSSKMFLAFALSMRSPATLIIFLLLLLLLFAFYPFRPVGGESLRQHNARYYYLSHNNRYYRLGKNKNLETYIIFYYYIRTHIYNYLPLRLAARQPPANNNQDPRTIL